MSEYNEFILTHEQKIKDLEQRVVRMCDFDVLSVEFLKLKTLVPNYHEEIYDALWKAIWDGYFAPRLLMEGDE